MKESKISIIIPVYNAELYIERCIISIIEQDYKNIEVILVDDCSSDQSVDVCKRLQSNDDRIQILQHKKNKGAAAARNTGIKAAKGLYVMFVDSDDYWDCNNVLTELIGIIDNSEQIDFVLFNRTDVDENQLAHKWKSFPMSTMGFKKNELFYSMTLENIYPVSSGMKIYKRDYLNKYKLLFREGVIWEDVLFYFQSLLYLSKAIAVNKYYYNACYNSKSVSRNISEKKVVDLYEILQDCLKYEIVDQDKKVVLYSILAYYYSILLAQSKYIRNKAIRQSIVSMKWILDYGLPSRIKIVRLLCKFCGIKFTAFVLSIYGDYKLKHR